MITLIRTNAFETNSSSCHTVTVGNTGTYEGKAPDSDGVVRFYSGEFGWDQTTYTDVDSRLSYAWIYATEWANSDPTFLERFKEVVCEHTGGTDVEPMRSGCTYYPAGYIDHQSVEDGQLHYIFADRATLKSFLFDAGSTIVTDNDNH